MRLYVINLDRRPDRLRAMTKQLDAFGLPFLRIRAIDAVSANTRLLDAHFASNGPLGTIPRGDKCCTLSHIQAWRAFLASGERLGAILEDDVVLDRSAADLLLRPDWIPSFVDLLKLEHFGPAGQRVLVGETIKVSADRSIGELHSRHTGAGAYIISRNAAMILLSALPAWTLPVDHMLFNPNTSPLTDRLRPYQLLPAIARQSRSFGGTTDIAASRIVANKMSFSYVGRELVRAYYELRLLPEQIARLASRRGALVRVENKHLTARSI